MKTNFDHNSDSLFTGMGFTKEQTELYVEKLNVIANRVVHEKMEQTRLAELLAEELSYNEILLMATSSMVDKIHDKLSDLSSALSEGDIESRIKQFKDLDEESLEELSKQGPISVGDGVSMQVVASDSEEGKRLIKMMGKTNPINLDDLDSCKD